MRISPQNTQNDIADSNPQTLFNYVAERLSSRGLGYLHVIEGDTSGIPVPPFDYMNLKRLFGGVVIANNGFDKERANEALAEGRADLIAFGKPFIANPDLVIRLLRRSYRSIVRHSMAVGNRATPTIRSCARLRPTPAIATPNGLGDNTVIQLRPRVNEWKDRQEVIMAHDPVADDADAAVLDWETGVCTENLNPDVVVMKSAKDRV